ncbi:MAG: glycoside hydrolase family 13 protein [Eubacterium sp.]|nr:glycoside hydrolase family 13 protein [Eubacterium sp.]
MQDMAERLGALSLAEKVQLYIFHTDPVLNLQALYTDRSANYVTPEEPVAGDKVKIRFRTARSNVSGIVFCAGDEEILMDLVESDDLFDYYETEISVGTEEISYYFAVPVGGSGFCYYTNAGILTTPDPEKAFRIVPGFSTPSWAKGAVFYQIYVDRFANGDPSNDVRDREYIYIDRPVHKVEDWYRAPEEMDVGNFYGGDLQGVLDHLDYLADLGVDAIYLNPIFVSPSNHKYDIQDYDYIDPHFGRIVKDEGETLPQWNAGNTDASGYKCRVTDPENLEASNEFFIHFTEEVHKRGMKVILDGVFNHCGSFNKWMDAERIYENRPGYEKGAFIDEASPFRHFFKFYDNRWPYNGDYDGWWGHKTLPKLNYEESDKLFHYIMHVGQKWVSPPYNADGWRLDVAADLGQTEEYNHYFWREFRKAVKEANPEAVILAEHYGDPSSWLEGDQWDTVMNYNAFMEPVTWFLTGMEKHSDERRPDLKGNVQAFWDAMRYHMSRMQYPSLTTAMNELSNHDHSRFLTRTNEKVGRIGSLGAHEADTDVHVEVMRNGVIIQMTWPGAPTIYYGDEAGLTGWTDPDNRRTYPWGREDQSLIRFHRQMIRIHKKQRALTEGSLKDLSTGREGVLAYGRFTGSERIIVVINGSGEDRDVRIPVWEAGLNRKEKLSSLVINTREGYDFSPLMFPVKNGILSLSVPAGGGMVLKASTKEK